MKLAKRTDVFLQGLVDEHRSRSSKGVNVSTTMIDHLLSLQESQPEYYTDQIIKGLILVSPKFCLMNFYYFLNHKANNA